MSTEESTQQPIRVYLLDDHEIVRRGLRETSSRAVRTWRSSASPAPRARRPVASPPCCLMSPCSTCASRTGPASRCVEIGSVDPRIRALMLTSYDDDQALVSSVSLERPATCSSRAERRGIVAAIRRVGAGGPLGPSAPEGAARALRRERRRADPRLKSLSPVERRILDLVADGMANGRSATVLSSPRRP